MTLSPITPNFIEQILINTHNLITTVCCASPVWRAPTRVCGPVVCCVEKWWLSVYISLIAVWKNQLLEPSYFPQHCLQGCRKAKCSCGAACVLCVLCARAYVGNVKDMNRGKWRQAFMMDAAAAGGGDSGGGGSSNGSSSSSSGPMSQKDILTAQLLLKKGKRYAASYLKDVCLRNLSPNDSEPPRTQVRLGSILPIVFLLTYF